MSKKPVAVCISDVHFKLDTLEVATAAFKMAIDKAAELSVPLIDCGDLTNDKAILRAEVVNRLLELRDYAADGRVFILSLVGNHSLLNEKSTAANALEFLQSDFWTTVNSPVQDSRFCYIPYQPSPEDFYAAIQIFKKGSVVFAHQGNLGGNMGDYIQDHSAVDPGRLTDWRVFSGHYHQHYVNQNWVSVGNPYTLTFGEANDGPKGFLIIYDDGSFEQIRTNLRKHVILEYSSYIRGIPIPNKEDIVWVKVTGTPSQLALEDKRFVAEVIGRSDFKFDKIPTESEKTDPSPLARLTDAEIMDSLIDGLRETDTQRGKLKMLWREVTTR